MTTQSLLPDEKRLVHALNMCIETCTDAEKGYAGAAADVRDPELKRLFQLRSSERADLVMALQTSVQKLGAFPENQGTLKGSLHNGWVNVRKAVEGRNDRMITEECERGEVAALERYQEASRHFSIDAMPTDVRVMFLEQAGSIQSALDALKHRFA
jgi:uncharacterized protein (TIGR02284 family)